MYLGKSLSSDKIIHRYCEINSNNEMSTKWSFGKSLFKKGTIGSVYECSFNNDTISYNKNEIPTSFIYKDKF